MGLGPFKRTGFKTDLYQATESIKEAYVGLLRIDSLGRKFRYAKSGGALIAGEVTVAAAINAAHMNEAILLSVAVGTQVLTLTVTAGTAIVANQLKGGMLQINDGTGEGYSYIIDSNTAITSAGTEINLTLAEPIRVALDSTSEFTLVANPWYGITHSGTIGAVTGGALCAVTSGYYCWVQTGGMGIVLTHETGAVGLGFEQSTTSGAVDSGDTDAQEFTGFGYYLGTAGVIGEFKPCIWTID